MPQLEAVVIGASAGGLQALLDIVEELPQGLLVPIFVVVHTRSEGDSLLPEILGRASTLPVVLAEQGATEPGVIYVAPPDFHLLITDEGMRLSHGPRENGFRPAVDPLFRTAARRYRNRVMGVILSGALDDGTYGLKLVKDAGGIAVVQDPDEATFPSMPSNALRFVDVDHVLPAAQIAALIANIAATSSKGEPAMARKAHSTTPGPRRQDQEPEPQNATDETDVQEMTEEFGAPSALTCPDCGGALWELQDGNLARYRCHVGHQFTQEGLDAEQHDLVENALWSAIRVLEEHAELRHRMARRADAAGMEVVTEAFEKSARESKQQAHTIRELLFGRAEPAPITQSEVHTARRVKRPPEGKRVNGKGRRTTRRRA